MASRNNKRKPTPSMYDDENAERELNRLLATKKDDPLIEEETPVEKPAEASTETPIEKTVEKETKDEVDESTDEDFDGEENEESVESDSEGEENEEKDRRNEQEDDGDEEGALINDQNNNRDTYKTFVKPIYQFKIWLDDTSPPVWRRVQVPGSFTFEHLHFIIQKTMGWFLCHMHEFRMLDPKVKNKIKEITINSDEEQHTKISDYYNLEDCHIKQACKDAYSIGEYEYDMGDGWIHIIKLEKVFEATEPLSKYPKCIAGKQACPPEDCGGTTGYEELKKLLKGPKNTEYKEMVHWLKHQRSGCGPYDPSYFDPKKIILNKGLFQFP